MRRRLKVPGLFAKVPTPAPPDAGQKERPVKETDLAWTTISYAMGEKERLTG